MSTPPTPFETLKSRVRRSLTLAWPSPTTTSSSSSSSHQDPSTAPRASPPPEPATGAMSRRSTMPNIPPTETDGAKALPTPPKQAHKRASRLSRSCATPYHATGATRPDSPWPTSSSGEDEDEDEERGDRGVERDITSFSGAAAARKHAERVALGGKHSDSDGSDDDDGREDGDADPPPPYSARRGSVRSGSGPSTRAPRSNAATTASIPARRDTEGGYIYITTPPPPPPPRRKTYATTSAGTAAQRREKRAENEYPGMEGRDREDLEGLTRWEVRDRGYYG